MFNKSPMSLPQFGSWLQEKTGAEIRATKDRTDCVINIDHIEPGKFIALYAVNSANSLVIVELAGSFNSTAAAWAALTSGEEAYPPVLFNDWLEQQYVTDREARVERLDI